MDIPKHTHPANGNDPGPKGPLIPSRIPKPRGCSTQAWLHPWQVMTGEMQIIWATSVCCSWRRSSSEKTPMYLKTIILKNQNNHDQSWQVWSAVAKQQALLEHSKAKRSPAMFREDHPYQPLGRARLGSAGPSREDSPSFLVALLENHGIKLKPWYMMKETE